MEREQHLSRSINPVTGYRSLPLQLQNHEIPGREAIYDQEQAISDGQGSRIHAALPPGLLRGLLHPSLLDVPRRKYPSTRSGHQEKALSCF